MTLQEAIHILEYANKWRRGADIEMPDPVEVGKAIDIAVKKLKENNAEDVNPYDIKSVSRARKKRSAKR